MIVPHLKDGDYEVPSNNRPISLFPVLSKVAEKIALTQFNDFLTKQKRTHSTPEREPQEPFYRNSEPSGY